MDIGGDALSLADKLALEWRPRRMSAASSTKT